MPRRWCFPMLLVCAYAAQLQSVFGQSVTEVTTSYHIGNSLTQDSQPLSLEAFAVAAGKQHRVGYDIRSGASLRTIVAEPENTTNPVSTYVEEFGRFGAALPNHAWTNVTMQPHSTGGSTLATDVDSILTLIDLTRSNPANANTRFFIYAAWPQLGNYQQQWNYPSPDVDSSPTIRAREYFTHLMNRVRAATDAEILMIPVGEVLNEIDVRLKQNAVPGYFSVNQFYRDALHFNDPLGRYTAALTTYATMFNRDPTEFTRPEGFFEGNPVNSDLIYALINDAVHDVVEGHPFSGIEEFPYPPASDLNIDGVVDDDDLSIWTGSLGKSAVADANVDGVVDYDDFLAWQARRGQVPRKTENFDPADVDESGLVDSEDLAVWSDTFGPGGQLDVDDDGDSDGADFLEWQRTTNVEFFTEDFNRDGLVDDADLEIWSTNAGYTPTADVDNDGLVDGADFLAWQREVGETWPLATVNATTVPEPSLHALALIASAGCSMIAGRRRAKALRTNSQAR